MQRWWIASLLLLIASLALGSCGKSEAQKAQELIDMKMFSEAKTLLAKALLEDPKDGDLQYLHGFVSLALNDNRGAQESFDRAIQVNPKKGVQVGKIYFDRGAGTLQSRAWATAKAWFDIAVRYDISLKPIIADAILDSARGEFDSNVIVALEVQKVALAYEPLRKPVAAKNIFEAASKKLPVASSVAVDLFQRAVDYDATLSTAASQALVKQVDLRIESQQALDLDDCLGLYSVALKYDRGLAKQISKGLFQLGIRELKFSPIAAMKPLIESTALDGGLKPQVANALGDRALSALDADNSVLAVDLVRGMIRLEQRDVFDRIAKQAYERARALKDDPDRFAKLVPLTQFARILFPSGTTDWSDLLLAAMKSNASSSANMNMLQTGLDCVEFDAKKKPDAARALVSSAVPLLKQIDVELAAISSYFEAAVAMDQSLRPVIADAVWAEFAQRLSSLSSLSRLGKDRFKTFSVMAYKFGIPLQHGANGGSSTLGLVEALWAYSNGAKGASESLVRIVAKDSNSPSGRVAAEILAPPTPGKYLFSMQRLQTEASYWEQPLDVQLTSIEVLAERLSLTFHVKWESGAGGELPLLYRSQNAATTTLGGHCERLYIVDDNGRKFDALGGFSGGTQSEVNDCARMIHVPGGGAVDIVAHFPMISPGARSIKFVSPSMSWNPTHGPYQGAWWVEGIKLKKGPFE